MGKRLISLLLVIVMFLTLIPAQVFAFSSNDVAGQWSSAAIEKCHDYGIMLGHDGYFRHKVEETKKTGTTSGKGSDDEDTDPVGTKFIVSAKFNGLTNITIETKKPLENLTKDNIVIKKSSGIAIKADYILDVYASAEKSSIATINLDRLAFDTEYSTATEYDENEKFSEVVTVELINYNAGTNYDYSAVEIEKNGSDYAEFMNIMVNSGEVPDVSSWFNINPAVKIGKKIDDNKLVGQIGTIKATMIVIDDPNAKAEDNDGKNDSGKDKENRTPDGKVLKTAQDYYDYFAPAASEFLRESSYGLVDIDVKLVKCSENNGVYRLSGNNSATYPAARGGNVDTYLYEALNLVKDDLKEQADNRDVLYVVAVENFDEISYGPTDVHGGKLSEIGLNGYGALVRIGQDSYSAFKKKAFIHELGHDLGLPDLYTEGDTSQIDAFSGSIDGYPGIGYWGIMSNINSPSHDFLGYEKWQFGWIRNDQVDIITEDGETTHELTASSVKGGSKLIAIPGDTKGVTYIIEYKRAAGVEVPPYKENSKPEFVNEGVLIYKIDANNQSMQSPITVVNLHQTDPLAEPQEAAYNALNKSVLGAKSGIYIYEDKAAGIVISVDPESSLPEDISAPYAVTVKKSTPSDEERKPVLSDAHFLDFTTIECLTKYDLRGIKGSSVKVLKDGEALTGVKLNRVAPGVLRVTIGANQINTVEDMENVEIYTNSFSFFKESNKAKVRSAELSDVTINLSDAKFEEFDKITLISDVDLSSCKAADYAITKQDGSIIPSSAYTVSYDDESKKATINFTNKSYFITTGSTLGVTVNTKIFTNFIPSSATGTQMKYGETNGIKLTSACTPISVEKLAKEITDISIIGEVVKPKYSVGDVMNFSQIKVKITYADSTTIETVLSSGYLDTEVSGDTTTLGIDKNAIFDFDGETLTVKFDVIEHSMNLANRFYGIQVYNTNKQLEYWSWKEGYISPWDRYATTVESNGAFYLRPTSWSGDTNKNLYEIYKGSSLLIGSEDSYVMQSDVPTEDTDKKAASWQIINLGNGTYAIVNADKGEAFAYLGEENGNPITITAFDTNNVKDNQRFILIPDKVSLPD